MPRDTRSRDTRPKANAIGDTPRSPAAAAGATAHIGEVAYLPVVTLNNTGAFLRRGQAGDVLLPFGEQLFRPDVGKRVLVMLYEDDRGRPVASMRLERFLSDDAWALENGEAVSLVVAERTDLGMKVVVNHRYWGLIYADDISQPLRRGQALGGFVKQRRDDGRVDVSLLPPGSARLDVVGDKVLKALRESGGYLPLGDKSAAEDIKARLGVSKSAYKQAIGRLYKRGLVTLEPHAVRLVPGASQTPE